MPDDVKAPESFHVHDPESGLSVDIHDSHGTAGLWVQKSDGGAMKACAGLYISHGERDEPALVLWGKGDKALPMAITHDAIQLPQASFRDEHRAILLDDLYEMVEAFKAAKAVAAFKVAPVDAPEPQ